MPASPQDKEHAIDAVLSFKSAETLREEAAERLKENLLQEVYRQQEQPLSPQTEPERQPLLLRHSKKFWFCIFGIVFLVYMYFLIVWVSHDSFFSK